MQFWGEEEDIDAIIWAIEHPEEQEELQKKLSSVYKALGGKGQVE
jgi:hypothetical protein